MTKSYNVRNALVLFAFVCGLFSALFAQGNHAPYLIDARSSAVSSPEIGFLQMGGTSASGKKLGVNSQFLTIDGKPWLPVMGEFHYSRYPEKYWNEELAKMKANGVTVVSTYVIWIHHEEVEGKFDWTGQRDLRHFLELCHDNGLYVWLRSGPWDHGEVRNGGFPDWLVAKKIPLRRNNPEYLRYVSQYYAELSKQVHGMFWKDGGPIIGMQLENEYNISGPGAGAEHIAELKRIAQDAGMDPPLFSIFSGNLQFPPREFLPFTGGYPDKFWVKQVTDLSPSSLYLFAPPRQTASDLGAIPQGQSSESAKVADPKLDYRHYPSLIAEGAGGMESSYRRRPLMSADDIVAVSLAGLGSGMNCLGYYMFQGGANPAGKLSTLQESRSTGYPNDLPVVRYDFQAPLGEYGQERESYVKLKMLHLFIKAFGSDLAPMLTSLPTVRPAGPKDVSVPRFALRSNGEAGFLFINNYVRKLELPGRKDFQVRLKLESGDMDVPRTPLDLPPNKYFIWPINLKVGDALLRYSTAQLLSRLDDQEQSTFFFFAPEGVRPEFAFDRNSISSLETTSGVTRESSSVTLVQNIQPGKNTILSITDDKGHSVRIILLTEREAKEFWQVSDGTEDKVLLTPAEVFRDRLGLHLRSTDRSDMKASLFVSSANDQSHWQQPIWHVKARTIDFRFNELRPALKRRSLRTESGGKTGDPTPLAPTDSNFKGAAAWSLTIPTQPMSGLSDIYVRIRYVGDVGRLYEDNHLMDDDFYNGLPWEVGLKRYLPAAFGKRLELEILPMPPNNLVYLDPSIKKTINSTGDTGSVPAVTVTPEYEMVWTARDMYARRVTKVLPTGALAPASR